MKQDSTGQSARGFRRRRKQTLIWTVVIFGVLMSGAFGSAMWLKGRELLAPVWIRDRIETFLAQRVPDYHIEFGDVVAVLDDNWLPRFSVRNLRLSTFDGAEIISVADVRAGLHGAALLDRQVILDSLDASGVLVTIQRSAEGEFSLSAGANIGSVTQEAPSMLQLIGKLDAILLRPTLAGLQRVDVRAVTMRYEDLRANRFWTVDGGRLRLDREGDDVQIAMDLAVLGGISGVATLAANYAGRIGEDAADFGITVANLDARDIASQGPALSWLRVLEAPISGALRGGIEENGVLSPLNATLQFGAGVIQPTPEASPIPIQSARSYLSYFPSEKRLRFDEFSVDSKWGSGRLEGQAILGDVTSGQLENLVGQFRLTNLSVNPDALYEEPVEISAAELDFRLKLAPFKLDIGRFQLSDQGQVLIAQGDVSAGPKGWDMAVDAHLDGMAASRLKELWPERLKPKTRSWISRNVKDGQIKEAVAAIRVVQGARPKIHLGFNFREADFTFMKSMPPVENASGHASLVKDRFSITFDEGGVTAGAGGFVDATGTSFIVPDTTVKPDPPGIVRLAAQGTVTASLSLLDRAPLEVMKKTGLPVNVAEGQMAVQGTLSMPLKKRTQVEEVTFDVQGVVTEARSTRLIKGRELIAPELMLYATDEAVAVAGKGTIDGVLLDVEWRQKIGRTGDKLPGKVTGEVIIDPAALEAFGVDLPPGTVQGSGTGEIELDMLKGKVPELVIQSDLQGLEVKVPPVGWSKPAERAGLLEVNMTLGDSPTVDRLVIDAPGLYADGSVNLTQERKLDRVRLDDLRIGNWLNAPVDLISQGEGNPLRVAVRGGVVDLRNANLPSSTQNGQGRSPLNVTLDRLQISDTIALTDLRGSFTTGGGLAGNFEGAINGASAITGQATPRNGRSAIRLTGQNAGNMLSAAGLMRQAKGGQMELDLVPVGSGGAFDGKLRVVDARITDAPTIAALLNSISVVGLVNELNGDGIHFSEITADFRLAPSRITLREAAAVGASMGLSMDGIFEPDSKRIQLQGVISPIYMLNSVGSVLTRRGEGLIGFNYSISGTVDDPQVFVNPLTALAPGMFRNLFRRSEPDVPLEEGEEAPKPEPRRTPVVTRGEDR